jgi:hypothetical protein
MQALEQTLWVKTSVGGMSRYENDYYYQVTQDLAQAQGNPWFICTLWLAQYRMHVRRRQMSCNWFSRCCNGSIDIPFPVASWRSRSIPSQVNHSVSLHRPGAIPRIS